MSEIRDFTEATITLMAENVDEKPSRWFTGAGRWFDKVTDGWMGDPPPALDSSGNATAAYFEHILEYNDIHAAKLKELLDAVWGYEADTASAMDTIVKNQMIPANKTLASLKEIISDGSFTASFSLVDALAATGVDYDKETEQAIADRADMRYNEAVDRLKEDIQKTYGTDFEANITAGFADAYDEPFSFDDWARTPEGVAIIRLQAARHGILMPLSQEQWVVSQPILNGILGDPVPTGTMWQPWPNYLSGSSHGGVDIKADKGENVAFTFVGIPGMTVVDCYTGWTESQGTSGNRSYGNYVKIGIPGIGPGGQTAVLTYGHLSKVDEKIVDHYVAYGSGKSLDIDALPESIGSVGNTGNCVPKTFSHLHFDVRIEGQRNCICPYPYLNGELTEEIVDRTGTTSYLNPLAYNENGEIQYDQNGQPIIKGKINGQKT